MDIIEKIISNFKNNKSLYIGENITIADHMIQSAMMAEKSKSKDSLVCSCLLHDYGHFILDDPDEYHVIAKRYLARDKKYYNRLSQASVVSLKLQGGLLNSKEAKAFEKEDFFKDAIKLRKFDEAAKQIGVKIKDIIQYKDLLKISLR